MGSFIGKYKRMVPTVEAIQLRPETFLDCELFVGEDNLNDGTSEDECFIGITTNEGSIDVRKGNYIIKKPEGGFSTLTREEFETHFESV